MPSISSLAKTHGFMGSGKSTSLALLPSLFAYDTREMHLPWLLPSLIHVVFYVRFEFPCRLTGLTRSPELLRCKANFSLVSQTIREKSVTRIDSISAFVPRFVNEQPVVLTGAASSSCLPHRDFVSMGQIYILYSYGAIRFVYHFHREYIM